MSKIVFLMWKRRELKLQIDKLMMQAPHSPYLWSKIAELEYQLKSIEEYLGYDRRE